MSRLISDILEAPEPHFSHRIQEWENLSNRAGHDLRLLSDITNIRREVLQALELDEADTTPKEFYFALRHKAAETNQKLSTKLEVTQNDTPEALMKKIIKLAEDLELPRDVWALKQATIKNLLKKQAPKKLLKALGLRSIDSVLKNYGPYDLLALAFQVETHEWKEKMLLKYRKLGPSDFIATKISISIIDQKRLEKIRRAGYKNTAAIIPNYDTGTIFLIPPKRRFELDVLGLTLFLLHCWRDMRMHSAYFRHISVKNDFGNKFSDAISNGLPGRADELKIGWKPLQRHLFHSPPAFATFEQPFLQAEDIVIIKPEKVLLKVLPEMELWDKSGYGFVLSDGQAVSMHLMDVVIDGSNKRPFERGTRNHLKARLWEELGYRYLKSEPIAVVVMDEY